MKDMTIGGQSIRQLREPRLKLLHWIDARFEHAFPKMCKSFVQLFRPSKGVRLGAGVFEASPPPDPAITYVTPISGNDGNR